MGDKSSDCDKQMNMDFRYMPMIGEVPQSSIKSFSIRENGSVLIRDAYLILNVWDVGSHHWNIKVNGKHNKIDFRDSDGLFATADGELPITHTDAKDSFRAWRTWFINRGKDAIDAINGTIEHLLQAYPQV